MVWRDKCTVRCLNATNGARRRKHKEAKAMNVTSVVVIWALLGIATLGLALYRKLLSNKEQDVIQLAPGEETHIPQQRDLARKMSSVDRWGKTMTVATAVIGLFLAGSYLYQAWQDPSSVPNTFYRRAAPDR